MLAQQVDYVLEGRDSIIEAHVQTRPGHPPHVRLDATQVCLYPKKLKSKLIYPQILLTKSRITHSLPFGLVISPAHRRETTAATAPLEIAVPSLLSPTAQPE